ncbi:MAG: hypothetical protein ACREJD_04715 [Phycisphaerales bacterium]
MIRNTRFVSVAALAVLAHSACAVWGVRYEVNSGSGWTNALTIDVASGVKNVDFRISMYHDGHEDLDADPVGTLFAWIPLRLTMSHKITNFGDAGVGDSVQSFKVAGNFGIGTLALAQSFDGINQILGTPNVRQSFVSNLFAGNPDPRPQQLEVTFYTGTLQIGNLGSLARSREILLTANSYSDPDHSAGLYGGTFYYNATGFALSKNALTSAVTLDAKITVIPAAASAAFALPLCVCIARRRRICGV